jgi:hypothetical protein
MPRGGRIRPLNRRRKGRKTNGRQEKTGHPLVYRAARGGFAGNGLSDAVYANYFKDAYHVDAVRRAFLELPREAPGVLCMLALAALGSLGEIRVALIAQVLAAVGLTALGLLTPTFGVMCVFCSSIRWACTCFSAAGFHRHVAGGARPRRAAHGQYGSVRTRGLRGGHPGVHGFRFGFFSFVTPVKWIFLIGAVVYRGRGRGHASDQGSRPRSAPQAGLPPDVPARIRHVLLPRDAHGVQKQVAFVFGSWAIIELWEKARTS